MANRSSLFRVAVKINKASKNAGAVSAAEDVTLEKDVPSLVSASSPTSGPDTVKKRPKKSSKASTKTHSLASSRSSSERVGSSSETPSVSSEESKKLREISSILCGHTSISSPEIQRPNDGNPTEKYLDIPWFSTTSNTGVSQHRKEILRERKQKWVFKNTQNHRFNRLLRMCDHKLGTEATFEVFGKLGRETGVKEYNALIALCIEKAKKSEDDEVSLHQIHKAFQLFISMREQGFQLEEETYGPFLRYLIDTEMIEEFQFFSRTIEEENPSSLSRLGYYEILLWIRVNNEDKIQELCNSISVDNGGNISNLLENYMLALCENDRKELLQLLDIVDITKISSLDCVATVFTSLGRLLLENFVEKFVLAFKSCESGRENISYLIYSYAISIPNLAVEDVILKFKKLHEKLEVKPSSTSYEKLILYCCDSLEVHAALDIVDHMCQAGFTLSNEIFHFILRASEESGEYNLVYQIYSVICHHKLKPNGEIFRSLINLCVKMKDFEGAYTMLKDVKEMNLIPTANMYNAILAGHIRERNLNGGLMVLKQMEDADVKPDCLTFSYLIGNCECEEDIVKFYEEFERSGVEPTKHIFMALINGYVNCGQFEKAKLVAWDKRLPMKSINEIKSVLVAALASHEQITDALRIYDEMREAGCTIEPKTIINLIEHLHSEGELSRLLQLLGELNDLDKWIDGCSRIFLYCVRHSELSSAVELIKKLKAKACKDLALDFLFNQAFCEIAEAEPTPVQNGLELLRAMKEELDLHPSRKDLDFLLSACVKAKDLPNAQLIWKEYQKASLPYNVLTFLRMYQGLLASGKHNKAKNILQDIPKDDPHVRCIIKSCQEIYIDSNSRNKNRKKK